MRFFIITILVLNSSCAVIVKTDKQRVHFKDGPDGITKIQTPGETVEIEDGQGVVMVSRSRPDIPVKVTCPDGSKKNADMKTSFGWGWGGWGNLFSWVFVGWVIDGFSDKAYDIEPVSLAGICEEKTKEVATK